MARRRMLSNEIIYDEDYNKLSIESQLLFTRLLTISDDCGVVPGNEYALKTMLNLSANIYSKLQEFINELIESKLILILVYSGKLFYCFKPESFQTQQAYIIKNRTKSEYLKIKVNEFIELYNKQILISNLQEFTEKYSNFLDNGSYHIKSIKHKVESKEYKAEGEILKKIEIPKVEKFFDDDFLKFWKIYDLDIQQDDCYESWKHIDIMNRELILQRVQNYIDSVDKTYLKEPLKYLSNKMWLDEVVKRKSGKQTTQRNNLQTFENPNPF